MNKICIIGFGSISHMPYLKHYIKTFDELSISYDIIYWNRFKINENFISKTLCNKYVYDEMLLDNFPLRKKFTAFIRYREFVKNILAKKKYNKLVILTTIPSILLIDILLIKKKLNYIIDIRDFTYENLFIYKLLLKQIVSRSYFTAISSLGFINFLPRSNKYILSLNCYEYNLNISTKTKNAYGTPLTILYIGAISYFDQNIKFLNLFGNNPNFEIEYVGEGPASQKLEEYCKEMNFFNVRFYKRYLPNEKHNFIKEADLIYNLYGNNNKLVIYAISNKLYESASYCKPILVCANTQMEKESVKNGFGFTISFDDKEMPQQLYNWYYNLDNEILSLNCKKYLLSAQETNSKFYIKLKKFILNE